MNYFYGTLLKPGSTTSTPFFNVTTEEIIETLKNLPKPIPSDRPHWWQLEMTKDKSKAWEEDHGESDLVSGVLVSVWLRTYGNVAISSLFPSIHNSRAGTERGVG